MSKLTTPREPSIHREARDSGRPPGRLILVSAITPTDAGEGKTTTSIGLAQGLARRGEHVCLALREPSLGPTFGQKGGATGGGRSRVIPEEDINLHFTGDFHAISAAHNLLATLLDNHMYHGNALDIDPLRVGRPENFDIRVQQVILAAGAGCLVPLLGDIVRMPGLPAAPQAERIDLVDGRVVGMNPG